MIPGGLSLALRCADNVARRVDRRRPEANALAGWFDEHRDRLGLPESEDFSPDGGRRMPLSAASWRRVCATVTRCLNAGAAETDMPAARWTEAVAGRLGLCDVERRLFALALFYCTDQCVERLVDKLNAARGRERNLVCDPVLLALLLDSEPDEVEQALMPTGRLMSCGLLEVDAQGILQVQFQINQLVRRSVQPGEDPWDRLLGPAVPATLPPDAFAHIGPSAKIAADLLRIAVRQREIGINILLYGPPGTGKTSFAATLAAQIDARLRAVTEQDEIGNEPTRRERLSGLKLAQRIAPLGESVLLFDEAEDGFARRNADGEDRAGSRVFMHRLLERTPVPVIWTANDIDVLGGAAVRRMTLCMEMKIPSVRVRTRLWRAMAETEGVALPELDAARLARLVPAAPAVAAVALRATRLVSGDAGTAQVIVEGIAHAVSGSRPTPPEADRLTAYDPALVNADTDLLTLADALCRTDAPKSVSLLLSGPPGTGKSAWVRHLADLMGLPVLTKRGSDLFGPYVGQTEAAIAAAFAEAREDGAFLVFDEADSLLADRTGAVRNWEVSQVNEMLTGMEHHPLPFACTTNLLDRLDRASLRRFLVKVGLDWMTAAQAKLAFRRFFDLPPPETLDDLRMLTPADFALVQRRASLMGLDQDADGLLRLMAAECEGRVGGQTRIGFAVS